MQKIPQFSLEHPVLHKHPVVDLVQENRYDQYPACSTRICMKLVSNKQGFYIPDYDSDALKQNQIHTYIDCKNT